MTLDGGGDSPASLFRPGGGSRGVGAAFDLGANSRYALEDATHLDARARNFGSYEFGIGKRRIGR